MSGALERISDTCISSRRGVCNSGDCRVGESDLVLLDLSIGKVNVSLKLISQIEDLVLKICFVLL